MAEIEPLKALHYVVEKTGGLQDVVAPPYDVIGPEQRSALEARSPFNVVRIDMPIGADPYAAAARQFTAWRTAGVIAGDPEPALWALEQQYIGPDGRPRTRRGFLAQVRIEEYGPGQIRRHERIHPGPKEDRLRLLRATKASLSPILSLFSDPEGKAWNALAATIARSPWGQTTDDAGTLNRLWRIVDPNVIAAVQGVLRPSELLIAAGHHRYETARAYAEEIGGDGPHRYTLMCLVALEDPGLTVFPTHRLLKNLRSDQREALAQAIRRDFDTRELERMQDLAPAYARERVTLGYIDGRSRRPYSLTLKDPAIADAALCDHAEPYRRLDTAVLEALILKGALEMTDDDIDHLVGLGYARSAEEALGLVMRGDYDAAFFMAPTPVGHVQAVAATGEPMPPKSTYFFPKVPTGLLFHSLSSE
jgi:uncharacterized protein (DUF1015 family)